MSDLDNVLKTLRDLHSHPGTREQRMSVYEEVLSGLSNIDPDYLDESELIKLVRVYHNVMEHEKGLKLALEKFHDNQDSHLMYLIGALISCACSDEKSYIEAIDKVIQLKIGDKAYWLIQKAQWYLVEAIHETSGEVEWSESHGIQDMEALHKSAFHLALAVREGAFTKHYVDDQPSDYGVSTWEEAWDIKWAPILSLREYSNLTSNALKD